MKSAVEILCTACGREALIKREAIYEGFKKIGERLLCSACGYIYQDEASVPYKQRGKPVIFSADERSRPPRIFDDEEKGRNCRHCRHYVVNPFVQRCGLSLREVQATDVCERFEEGEKPASREWRD